jgi:hypothetical protein
MLAEVLVHAHAELISMRRQSLGADKCVPAGIGPRIKGQQILGDGIDKRELIEWQWLRWRIWRDKKIEELAAVLADFAGGVVDAVAHGVKGPLIQRAQVAKINLPLGIRRYGGASGFPMAVAQSFVVAKEKSAIFPDGCAESAAELVAVERLHAIGEKAFGVHGIVAQEVPCGAVEIVGAGARDDVGGAAGAVAELRSSTMTKLPSASDSTVREKPVSTSVTTMDALRTMPPVASITRPRKLAVVCCA